MNDTPTMDPALRALLHAMNALDNLRPAIQRLRRAGWTINVGLEEGNGVHRFTVSGEWRPEDPPSPERGAEADGNV